MKIKFLNIRIMYTFKSIIINREDEDDKYLMFLLLIEEPSLESTSPDISPCGIFILFIPFVVS